jgi:hypothetical protein
MTETSHSWQGIPREQIDWAPAIDESLCSYIAHLIKENHVLVEAKRKLEELRIAGDDEG